MQTIEMEERKNVFANYFNFCINYLKFCGIWIENSKNKSRYLQHFYNILICFYIYILYWPTEVLYIFISLKELGTLLQALRDCGNHILGVYKYLNYLILRRRIVHLIDTLTQRYHYEDCEDFRPEEIVKKEEKQLQNWMTFLIFIANANRTAMLFVGLYKFFKKGDQFFVVEDGQMVYRQPQPVNLVFSPFGSGTRTSFLLTFLHILLSGYIMAWQVVACDCLFVTLMSGVGAHLKVLQGAFSTIRQRCVRRIAVDEPSDKTLLDSKKLQEEVHKEMAKCIRHLQTIFRVADELEEIFNFQTLCQVLIALEGMCFSLYIMSVSTVLEMVRQLSFFMVITVEILVYCWFGDRITEASDGLTFAIYESDWFSTSLSFRKQMLVNMARSMKPIYITIGKVTPLTFVTFLTILRGAYSFYTFLKQVQE